MELSLSFTQFWTFAIHRAEHRNALAYHKCCDSWTSRNANTIRATHIEEISWSKIISTLDRSVEDRSQALQAKMIAEGMQIPVIVNRPCKTNPTQKVASKRGRKPQAALNQPEIVEPAPAEVEFTFRDQGPNDLVTPSGRYPMTKIQSTHN